MATHDYVIANGTGAAVRSDLNDALAAIVSNNSGSSEPATTYAYQWWADTTANVLKIRNSANNAWITLRELDGTMLIEDGTAAAPGLSFASDTNTGIFRSSNNALAVSANGSVRMTMSNSSVVVNQDGENVDFRVESSNQTHMLFVDAGNDRVGIGTSSPGTVLHIAEEKTGGTAELRIFNTDNTDATSQQAAVVMGPDSRSSGAKIAAIKENADFSTSAGRDISLAFLSVKNGTQTEAARIDSSGRLLVGTTSVYSPSGGGQVPVTVVDSGDHRTALVVSNQTNGSSAGSAVVLAAHGEDWQLEATSVSKGSKAFTITAGTNERLRIDSEGKLLVGTTSAPDVGATRSVQIVNTSTASISLARNDSSISSGNDIGAIRFWGNDGGSYQQCAEILAEADGDHADNDKPTRLVFSTTADGASSPTERMRIDSSGNVAIGRSSALSKLHVSSSNGNADARIGGDSAPLGLTLSYDQAGSTVSKITANPTYTSTSSRLHICVDGDANPDQLVLNGAGRVGIGTSSPGVPLHIASQSPSIRLQSNSGSYQGRNTLGQFDNILYLECDNDNAVGSSAIAFTIDANERMRLFADGRIAFDGRGVTTSHNSQDVFYYKEGHIYVANGGDAVMFLNRNTNDGNILHFRQNNTDEGTISVSGSTVSYNGAHLSRWSQLADNAERTEILRGSVLSNLDEMCEWAHAAQDAVLYTAEDELPEGASIGDVKTPAVEAYTEDNEQLNRMKVSDVEGDVNVAGVFQAWDDDDDTYTNDFYCAMTGDFIIRIAQGTTVARGDLLMSAGDGTAKPQGDDIVRSKTIAKVTSTTVSTTYSDGSYCVPCVLMAC